MDIVEQGMVEAHIAASSDAGYGKPKPPKPRPKPKKAFLSNILFGLAVLFFLLLIIGFGLGYDG